MKGLISKNNQLNNRQSWISYTVISLFLLMQFSLQGTIGLMVDELTAVWTLDKTQVGLLSSAFFYSYVVLQIPAGRLISIYGIRICMFWASLLLAMSCLLFANAQTFEMAFFARFLMGISSTPGVVALMEVINTRFSFQMISYLIGAMELCAMIGGATAAILVPIGVKYYGWQGAMYVFTGCLTFIALIIYLKIPSKQNALGLYEKLEAKGISSIQDSSINLSNSPSNTSIWSIFIDLELWLVGLYGGFLFTVLNVFAALWALPFLKEVLITSFGLSAANLVALIFIGASMGGVITSIILARWRIPYIYMLVCATAVLSLLALVTFVPLNSWLLAGTMFILGFSSSAYLVPFILLKDRFFAEKRAIATGLTNMLSIALGSLILQPLIGWLIYRYTLNDIDLVQAYQKSFHVIFYGLAMAILIAIFYCIKGQKERKNKGNVKSDYEVVPPPPSHNEDSQNIHKESHPDNAGNSKTLTA